MTLNQIKLLIGSILLGLIIWAIHHSGYIEGVTEIQSAWDADKAERQVEFNKQLLEQADKVTKGAIQHEKDLQTVASAVAAADSIRVHFPRTPCTLPAIAKTSPNTSGASGVVQPTVDGEFAIFQTRVGKIIERCDKLNADAIQSNSVTQ